MASIICKRTRNKILRVNDMAICVAVSELSSVVLMNEQNFLVSEGEVYYRLSCCSIQHGRRLFKEGI